MRSTPFYSGRNWLAALLAIAALSSPALAKSFKGVTPGETRRDRVIDKFGAPTKEFSKGGKLSDGISYQADEAISGTLEANFFFDKHGVLFRIDVYPAKRLTKDQVTRVYGKDYSERLTRKGSRYIRYSKAGLTIFFEKDEDVVRVFMFTAAVSEKETPWGG